MKLSTKITTGAMLVIAALMTVTSLFVTYIVDRQNVSISHEIIRNAFHAIEMELSEMRTEQLGASRQVAAIEGLGTDVKYLSSGSVLGYAEGYPSAVFSTLYLSPGSASMIKTNTIPGRRPPALTGISLTAIIQVPQDGMIQYKVIDGDLCLQSVVPIKGLEFNQQADQLESDTVGFFMAIQRIGNDFTRRMAKLTGQQVGIFHEGVQLAVQLPGYERIQSPGSWSAADAETFSAATILQNEVTISGEDYYQGILPLDSHGQSAASIAVLYSRDLALKN